MTESDTDAEDVEDVEDVDAEEIEDVDAETEDVDAETEETDADSAPDMDSEEFADLPDSLADEVEESAGAGAESEEDTETTEDSDDDAESDSPSVSKDWGEMYVGTLTSVTNEIIKEHGKDGAEPIEESLARDLHLDEYFNDWMAEQGKREDLDPGQALMMTNIVFFVTVIGTRTDLPSKLLEQAKERTPETTA